MDLCHSKRFEELAGWRFYYFVIFFDKRRWKLQKFNLKIKTIVYCQSASQPQKRLILR